MAGLGLQGLDLQSAKLLINMDNPLMLTRVAGVLVRFTPEIRVVLKAVLVDSAERIGLLSVTASSRWFFLGDYSRNLHTAVVLTLPDWIAECDHLESLRKMHASESQREEVFGDQSEIGGQR